jgi:hypothetical protein
MWHEVGDNLDMSVGAWGKDDNLLRPRWQNKEALNA